MSLKKITFPNNLECYYISSKQETQSIFKEIFVEQQYLQNGIVVKEGDCIFDVGANIGLFSIFLNKHELVEIKDVLKSSLNPNQEQFEYMTKSSQFMSKVRTLSSFSLSYVIGLLSNSIKFFRTLLHYRYNT